LKKASKEAQAKFIVAKNEKNMVVKTTASTKIMALSHESSEEKYHQAQRKSTYSIKKAQDAVT
jgi:hypothetical protein